MTSVLDFHLDFTYREASHPSLSDVCGSVCRGKCIVLCGSSGCGKTTLLRCFNHLIPQFYEGELKGDCFLEGKDMKELSIGQTGQIAGSVFQDPRSQFFTLNSDTELAFGLENFGYTTDQIHHRIDECYRYFNMDKLRDRNVFSLSSGERQMTAILSAFAPETEVLLLDEPTANLDLQSIDQLTQALQELKNSGKTMIISEHRLYYLKDIADEYWLMDQGRIIQKIPASSMNQLTLDQLHQLHLRTLDLSLVHSALIPVSVSPAHTLQVHDLDFHYKKGPEVLSSFNLTAHTGEVIALTGSNGCGKTTLGKLLAGLLKPDRGSVVVDNRPVCDRQLSSQSLFILQEAEFQFFTDTVTNELLYGLKDSDQKKEEIEELLHLTGLWECRNRHPFSLSGGQMQKLVLLNACLTDKPVVILDEPTAGLDYESLVCVASLIRRMQKEKIIFLISHDLELLSMVATRNIAIQDHHILTDRSLADSSAFEQLKQDMTHSCPPSIQTPRKSLLKPLLDPRLKLLYCAAAMIAAIGTDLPLILSVFFLFLLAFLKERKWKTLFVSMISMLTVTGLYFLVPCVATSFIAHFFPRMVLIGCGAALVLPPQENSRMITGLRTLHVPEKVIMVMTVMFRFFPVLHADLKLMKQSIRTRGIFLTFSDKLQAIPEYLEILIVPMVFRVLRIADSLSASAETRGIALNTHRHSYTTIHWTTTDTLFTLLLPLAILIPLFL